MMKLTVLGNNGPYPGAGGACSGYLIEEEETKILIDCGNGVLSRLQKYVGLDMLNGIIISHLHGDHMADLLVLRYAADILQNKGMLNKPIDLYIPFEPREDFNKLCYKNAFNMNEIIENDEIIIGSLTFSFKKMEHPVLTYAVKGKSKNRTLVYSADTSYNENLIGFASNCDLLLCEAAIMDRDRGEKPVHLTPSESGDIALRAGAKRLFLTHFWPGYNIEEVLNEARRVYPSVEAAQQLKTYNV